MSQEYNPLEHSIVQGLIRNEPHERYEATDFHEALLFAIAREIGRVHHNRYQTSWDRWSDDPHIPGIQWRRYVYDCDCPETDDGFIPRHLETCVVGQPNFGFEDVRFSWYKNPGRGMSVNKDWPADQWQAWFERCIHNVKQFDTHAAGSSDHSLGPLPDDDDFNSAACQVLFRPNWPDQQSDIASVRTAATEGQKDLGKKQWEILAPLSERDVLAIVLGIMAEKIRAERNDRPLANPRPAPPRTP